MKRFSDFAKPGGPLIGEKIKISEILDKEIEITGHSIQKSKKNDGDFLTIQLRYDGQLRVLFTGSNVLLNQFKEYGKEIPFFTTIKQLGTCYALS